MTCTTLHQVQGSHLTEGHRQSLLALIAEHPLLTCPQIAALFEARTGRRLSVTTVRRAWVRGYKPVDPGDHHRSLTEAERSALLDLCREAAPHFNRMEIARRFEAVTGRPIQPCNVKKYLRTRLGIVEAKRPGRPPGKVVTR